MFASMVLLTLLQATLGAWSTWGLECPLPEDIYPCTCTGFPKNIVRCRDIRNLDTVREVLSDHFKKPLPKLEISNIHALQLPHHAFRNISTKRLYLRDNNLKRIDDDAFNGQEGLGLLILSEDRLTEMPTEALKHLIGLRTLSLEGNFIMQLSGQPFRHIHRLKDLILNDNRLTHMEQNVFPKSLESLSLSGNLLTTLNGTLENISRLNVFFGSNNRLLSVRHEFDGLSQLVHLGLDGNSITEIDDGSFDDLVSLKSLNLAYNHLSDVGDGLYPLKSLQHLNLSYNYIMELNADLFKSLINLETLDLSGNYLKNTCAVLKPLRRLVDLRLSNTNLRETMTFDCFQNLKSLRKLDLSQNDLVNVIPLTAHHFPKLVSLNLNDNRLNFFRHGLKNLRNLNELDIGNNRLRSLKSHYMMHNTQLRTLKIAGNPWECSDHFLAILEAMETQKVNIVGAPLCYRDYNAL